MLTDVLQVDAMIPADVVATLLSVPARLVVPPGPEGEPWRCIAGSALTALAEPLRLAVPESDTAASCTVSEQFLVELAVVTTSDEGSADMQKTAVLREAQPAVLVSLLGKDSS
jgi:hypothetical protein